MEYMVVLGDIVLLEYTMATVMYGSFQSKVIPSLPLVWRLLGCNRLVYRGWLYEDLDGRRPERHPNFIRHSSSGEVVLEPNQVWVESANSKLWVVTQIALHDDGDLWISMDRYKAKGFDWQLSESTLKATMEIWMV